MIRILIAEDQAMVRGALAALLNLEPDLTVVAEIDHGDQIVPAAIEQQPDIALLDIELPGKDGLTAAGELRTTVPDCRVIMVTTFGRSGFLRRAMAAGTKGFVLKDAPAQELAVAIRRVMNGEHVVDPHFAAVALSEGDNPLTSRERETLAVALNGESIAQIAARLFLSEGTVRNHLSIAIQKLGVRNRIEAARLAEEKGWLG
jgi:two-component system, NarL family, response regulator DesR